MVKNLNQHGHNNVLKPSLDILSFVTVILNTYQVLLLLLCLLLITTGKFDTAISRKNIFITVTLAVFSPSPPLNMGFVYHILLIKIF